MTYKIEVTRHFYGPRTSTSLLQDENGEPTFASLREATARIEELDDQPYETAHDESGRPSYRAVRAKGSRSYRTYKGCTIVKTSAVEASTLRPLYAISGRLTKNHGTRPFLTSIVDCKDWINVKDDFDARQAEQAE